jgi:Domain of unknown function (DUF4189)
MRNVALAAVIGLLFAAGSLVAAPVARADCSPFEGCWGAIAASPSNGQTQLTTNAWSQQDAENDVVLWCDIYSKVNDCQVVISGMGCLSIAKSSDGTAYAGRVAPTQDAADSAALDGAGPGGTILQHGCNG